MADDRSRRGLNPNAQAFVPNPAARPFIPGQPYMFTNPPPPVYGQPPPPFPLYMNAQAGVPFQYAQPQQPFIAPEQQAFLSQTQPTAETWDAGLDEEEGAQNSEKPVEIAAEHEKTELSTEEKEAASEPEELKTEERKTAQKEERNVTGVEEMECAPSGDDDEEVTAVESKLRTTDILDGAGRKEHVNMVFIGHVDAGKSTICGQLLHLTGMVDKRTLEKYLKEAKDKGRESWYLSWAMDTNDEEREKGKTVECGRSYFETENKHFTILDAPGHKSFVPNMISGATQADLAVMVISARKGEFETGFDRGGQTREHAMLVKTAGVRHMIVLVNKMDDPTVNWDENRYKDIQEKLTPYLRKCGYTKADIVYIPVSGLTGAFMKNPPQSNVCPWYTGPCFIEYIDKMLPSVARDYEGPVRVIIADKYSDMGTIIIGKVESGIVVKGQTVTVMPNRTNVQVIQLWSDDVETEKVASGDNVKLKLKGIDDTDILPGFVLCSPESLCRAGKVFDAEVVIQEHKSIIASGYSCVLHIHAAIEEVTVKAVICTFDRKTGNKVKARFVKQHEKCIMRLEGAEVFCLEPFKTFQQMGRFTLRDEGKTIAVGKVLKVVE